MFLHRSVRGVTVHTPAKLNLFFEVLAKRDDGYHEIESVVYPIDLFDTLYFRPESSGQMRFVCNTDSGRRGANGSGIGEIPLGSENLVVRAVDLLRRRAGTLKGATIELVKRIPSAAGLGGGSSDAAAALRAANVVWGLGWPLTRLKQLGAELGSDVPFFLTTGAATCRGRGEVVEPLAGVGPLHFVLVHPPTGLSTAAVYGACRAAEEPLRPLGLVEALLSGNLGLTGRLLFNRLEAAAETLSPWIERLRCEFAAMGFLGYQMTGSGTCYFGLCRHARQARRAARRLEARSLGIAYAVRGSR